MKSKFVYSCFCIAALALSLSGETTESILSRMDKAAPSFQGVTADLKMTTYNKVLDDKTVEYGTLQMQRTKAKETRAVIDFSAQTDARIIGFEGKNVRMYYPKLDEYTDTSLGKDSNVLNRFLLLGFGTSGKDLAANYTIKNEGTDKANGSAATKLLLTANDNQVKERIEKVEIWVAEGAAYPIQQQFYQPSGNYQLVSYSKVVINPSGQGRVKLEMPSTAKKQKQ